MQPRYLKNQITEFFLHSHAKGETIRFRVYPNEGNVLVQYQLTLDPDEELGEETLTIEEARAAWKKYKGEGFHKAKTWHACGKRRGWAEDYPED